MDELDALLGDLGKDVRASAPASRPVSTAAGRGISVMPRTSAAAPSAAAGRGRPTSGLDDLDSLITQLGGGGAPAPAAQPQPQPQHRPAAAATPTAAYARPKSDVDDIDALMASLSLPGAGGPAAAAPTPANIGRGPAPRASGTGDGLLNDLDALMASLGEPSSPASPAAAAAGPRASAAYAAGPGAARPGASPVAGRGAAPAGMAGSPVGSRLSSAAQPPNRQSQDLDSLLNSLQVDSRTAPAPYHPPAAAAAPVSGGSPYGGSAGGSPYGGGYPQQPQPQQQQQPGSGGFRPPVAAGAGGQQVPKGSCSTCQRPIQGPMMQALGGSYHPNCFICGSCGESLGSGSFFQTDNRPTCARCYQSQACARCAHCNKPIQGQCMTALNKQWHVNCFICAQCLKPFGMAPFFERDGNPFCESCLHGIFSSRCGACDQPIKGETVNACGKQWHPECFVCSHCRRAFSGQPYFEHAGRPYCQLHYHSQIGATCGCGCGRSIMGRVVQALGRQWLPEHFLCGFCMNSLAGQNFTQRDNKAYCNGCFGKLFAA